MKTIKLSVLISLLTALAFSSCELALGPMLDLDGPLVEITEPVARKAVPAAFTIKGTASDQREIKKLLVTASWEGTEFSKQWRYTENKWEISNNYGITWSLYTAEGLQWNAGSEKVSWALPVDMTIIGEEIKDGEYLFIVQAWDIGDMTDNNSIRTRVFIVDKNPPKVDIVNISLYRGKDAWQKAPLDEFHNIPDDGLERFEPSNIGKFFTQNFDMQWEVDDNHDVDTVDIRFYKHDAVIDEIPGTELPGDYIFRYYKPLPEDEFQNNIKPNGTIKVPRLEGDSNFYDGELKNPITEKTTVMIVATSIDSAGNPNQEKIIGYFLYWPLADFPWIIYTDGMETPEYYQGLIGAPNKDGGVYADIEEILKAEAFMIYPGRTIRATAYHNHGVKDVIFDLYTFDEKGGGLSSSPLSDFTKLSETNAIRPNGSYSTIFPWEFRPPARSGYFVVVATTRSVSGKESIEYASLFRVQDISFPDFPQPISPNASDPLFMHVDVEENTITISGIVRDATQVENLDMVWINPQSAGFATQNQIRYFKEPEFTGWMKIEELLGGEIETKTDGSAVLISKGTSSIDLLNNSDFIEESYLENKNAPGVTHHPNKIWRLAVNWKEEDQDTRQVFEFSITINLNDFNIGLDNQPLKSQVFLFKAKNPDNRTTIITYAPQGDESPPVLSIENVTIKDKDGDDFVYKPQQYALIPRFIGNEIITINGRWREDSAKYLPINDYFSANFKAEINTKLIPITSITVAHDPNSNPFYETEGTWTAVVNVGQNNISASDLRDSLVIAVRTSDIGGNVSEAGGSWLVESDDLRLLRISSNQDGTFKAGDTIDIFLEFSKAVTLKFTQDPVLTLSSTGAGAAATATYVPNASQSTRQVFRYMVGDGHTTGANDRLNVTGIQTGTEWSANNYPFTWVRGSTDTYEEIRVTTGQSTHTGGVIPNNSVNPVVASGGRVYARQLPTTTNTAQSDYAFTLAAGKNIKIDTAAPTVSSIADTNSGEKHYTTGDDIYIRVRFSEPVQIGSTVPRLQLQVRNTAASGDPRYVNATTVLTSSSADDVRVNGSDITFVYKVYAGDTTQQNLIIVAGYTGEITDLAGTPLALNGITVLAENDRTLTSKYINTLAPEVPTIRLLSSNNITNVVKNNVGTSGTTVTHEGISTAANRALSNVYHPELYLAVELNNNSVSGSGSFSGNNNLAVSGGLEYSINNGTSWVKVPNTSNTPFSGLLPGQYTLVARQINRAGMVSANTPPITFTWDPGELVTRISSATPNGTYTHNSGNIAITVTFRKNMIFAAGSTIELNARRGNAGSAYSEADPAVVVSSSSITANSITFNYGVQNGDNTPTTGTDLQQLLDVTKISITAWDGASAGNGVSSTPGISHLVADRLNGNKQFKVSTGNLSISTVPAFSDSVPGAVTGTANQGNANYHGIREDDGSYWTTLQFAFNRNVYKNDGEIIIKQNAANYRLPIVLNETQYNRFRTVNGFDTYYTKGTYGFNNATSSSDTSTKYILQYRYNPQDGASGTFTAGTNANQGPDADTAVPNAFHESFRTAEEIRINVNSSSVTIDGGTVRVRLSGANAPQVPGAAYTVTIPAGFVQDSLGNMNTASGTTYSNVPLEGVARPFVRIRKVQDTISTATGSITQPRLVATQPMYAFVRMDSRTPGSDVRYIRTESSTGTLTTVTDGGNSNFSTGSGPTDNNDPVSAPGQITNSTTGTAAPAQIVIGDANYNGYQWRVRARAFVGTTGSYDTEEMAYRTVITYQLRNAANAITASSGESIMAAGDQVWIRGGDAVGSSSIPGFPLTWEDNWTNLTNRRAGIRLMTKVDNTFATTARAATSNQYTGPTNNALGPTGTVLQVTVGTNATVYYLGVVSGTNGTFRLYTTQAAAANPTGNGVDAGASPININITGGGGLNCSVWRWVTWEINTTAYVDFIRGRDLTVTTTGNEDPVIMTGSTPAVAWQYGPKRVAYQRAGWTSFKYQYPIYPGKHRYCDAGYQYEGKGAINFSNTFHSRPANTDTNNWTSPPAATLNAR